MKVCTKCNVGKESEQYSLQKQAKDGRHTTCKTCINKRQAEKWAQGLIARRPYTYAKQLARYGMKQEDYDSMYTNQDGQCAICDKPCVLVVDHCHLSSRVRGLLCTSCNTALGKFKDSKSLLERAILYLG